MLIADTNTVTGEIAECAAADILEIWPNSRIMFASVMLDISLESMLGIDYLISAFRTNERRTLSREAATRDGISNDVFVFPWENMEEQWAEIQAAESCIGSALGHSGNRSYVNHNLQRPLSKACTLPTLPLTIRKPPVASFYSRIWAICRARSSPCCARQKSNSANLRAALCVLRHGSLRVPQIPPRPSWQRADVPGFSAR
jgi:hypothetical protein